MINRKYDETAVKLKLGDLELAYMYACDDHFGNSAVINRETGAILLLSELGDGDEPPPDLDNDDKYLSLPTKFDLDLGNQLVFEFAKHRPELDYEKVRSLFRRKGAYGRFRALLDEADLTSRWHEYQDEQTAAALKEWCKENNIELVRE